jgi:RNase P/RNase MRP subunit p29
LGGGNKRPVNRRQNVARSTLLGKKTRIINKLQDNERNFYTGITGYTIVFFNKKATRIPLRLHEWIHDE